MEPQFIGQFLIKLGYISKEQLLRAVKLQKQRIPRIGAIAIEQGFLTKTQANQVNEAQRRIDKPFGELAVTLGFLSREQLAQVLDIQSNRHIHLGELLVEEGLLAPDALAEAVREYYNQPQPPASLHECLPDGVAQREELLVLSLDSTVKLFRRVLDIKMKVGRGRLLTGSVENRYLLCMIRIEGMVETAYLLGLTRETATRIADHLANASGQIWDDDILGDCIGEFCNSICGFLVLRLEERGLKVTFSPPQCFFGNACPQYSLESNQSAVVFPCSIPEGSFEVGLIT